MPFLNFHGKVLIPSSEVSLLELELKLFLGSLQIFHKVSKTQ